MFTNFFSNPLSWFGVTNPWAGYALWGGILAGLLGSIVLLYFLKLKRQPVEVPSTYLWHRTIEDLHVNTIWQRLRQSLLLFLQLLLIALAMAALLRPGWSGQTLVGERLIFLIDTSASMAATDVKPNRLAVAKERIGEMIDQMRSDQVAMIISFSDVARVEQSFTDSRRDL
ncbi:MAG: VWA domain-containing protein, partial [Planctomycetes bacterium]|nr:VWA domain-containing protein [Planctomycetota bacterium]